MRRKRKKFFSDMPFPTAEHRVVLMQGSKKDTRVFQHTGRLLCRELHTARSAIRRRQSVVFCTERGTAVAGSVHHIVYKRTQHRASYYTYTSRLPYRQLQTCLTLSSQSSIVRYETETSHSLVGYCIALHGTATVFDLLRYRLTLVAIIFLLHTNYRFAFNTHIRPIFSQWRSVFKAAVQV